jgi:hypothetical protein
MQKETKVKVSSYTAKKPKDYKDHDGRVLAYVPPSNQWAKKDPKRS